MQIVHLGGNGKFPYGIREIRLGGKWGNAGILGALQGATTVGSSCREMGKQPTVMLLKLVWVSDSLGGLVKTWVPGAHPSEILIQ